MDKLKELMAVFLGVVAQYFGKYALILALVCIVVCFDIITGIVNAKANGIPITSEKGTNGFWKKLQLLVGLFFGIFLDFAIPVFLEAGLRIELPYATPFGIIVGVYIILNESISIVKNLYGTNTKIIPKPIADFLNLSLDIMDGNKTEENVK